MGCFMELSEGGRSPIELSNGEKRDWIHSGDTMKLVASASNGSVTIGFGECENLIK